MPSPHPEGVLQRCSAGVDISHPTLESGGRTEITVASSASGRVASNGGDVDGQIFRGNRLSLIGLYTWITEPTTYNDACGSKATDHSPRVALAGAATENLRQTSASISALGT